MRIQLIQFIDGRREVEQLHSGSDADDVENESVVFETPLGSNRCSGSGNVSQPSFQTSNFPMVLWL